MKCEKAIVVSSEELQILAAASGLKFMPIYQSGSLFSRTKQIEALYALLRDGLLNHTRQGMTLGDGLKPFSSALKISQTAVSVRALRSGTPPICVFGSEENTEYMYVMPTESKENYYRMGLLPESDLLETLEQMYILPNLHHDPVSSENVVDNTEVLTSLESLKDWETETISSFFGQNLISTFEKYALNDPDCIEKLLVLFSPASYIMVKWSKERVGIEPYQKEAIVRWLKE